MSTTFERDDATRRIRLTIDGPLTMAELFPLVTRLRTPELLADSVLWDFRDASITRNGFSLIACRDAILALDRGTPRPGRVALVVHGEAALSLARACVLLGSMAGYEAMAFRDIDAANAWLDGARTTSVA